MSEEANRLQIKQHLVAQFGLPEDQIEPLLTPFFLAISEYQEELENAIKIGENESIAKVAHKYKGALLNLGMKQAANLAQNIEHAAKEQQVLSYYQQVTIQLAEMISPLLE